MNLVSLNLLANILITMKPIMEVMEGMQWMEEMEGMQVQGLNMSTKPIPILRAAPQRIP